MPLLGGFNPFQRDAREVKALHLTLPQQAQRAVRQDSHALVDIVGGVEGARIYLAALKNTPVIRGFTALPGGTPVVRLDDGG